VTEVYHELGAEAQRLDEDPMVLIERFHGHVGPYVVLGYRSGRLAQEKLGVNAFRLMAEVFAGSRPPMSCFADGVQLGSGCTLGKRNITLQDDELVEARFTREDGSCLRMRARPETLARLTPPLEKEDLVIVSAELMAMPAEELFIITEE
jgi:formylmethanofuran dehydrogenase subunit E